MKDKAIQRPAAEDRFHDQLVMLQQEDHGPVPPGWLLSPTAIEHFVLGNEALGIERKFVAPREMVSRVIVSLATNRGAMLIGEPGTAKSWLSELIACGVSGQSRLTIQGGNCRSTLIEIFRRLLDGTRKPVEHLDCFVSIPLQPIHISNRQHAIV